MALTGSSLFLIYPAVYITAPSLHILSLSLISYMRKRAGIQEGGRLFPHGAHFHYQENRAQRAWSTAVCVLFFASVCVCITGRGSVEVGTISGCHIAICIVFLSLLGEI